MANMLPNQDKESASGTVNNLYAGPFEKTASNDNMSDGMGIARPAQAKPFETSPGSAQSETNKLREREVARFESLRSAGALGQKQVITNEGIRLDTFGGNVGGAGPMDNEQSEKRDY